jgi:hypothetical protein
MAYADLVKETTATTGTGDIALSGAVQSASAGYFRSFGQAHSVGDKVFYAIRHTATAEFEVGLGTLTDAGHLSRDTVYTSSNNNQLVSFSSGTKEVSGTIPAAQLSKLGAPDAAQVTTLANPTTASLLTEDGGTIKRIKTADFFTQFGTSPSQVPDAGTLAGTNRALLDQGDGTERGLSLDNLYGWLKPKFDALYAAIGSTGGSGTTATAITMTGPTTGVVSTQSSNFTVGVSPVGGAISGTITVTPSDNGGGGSFSPTSVSLTSASPTATFKYTPSATVGARTISVTNSAALTNPSNITYTSTSSAATAVQVTGPTSGTVSVASTNFTASANGTITGTIVVTPSDNGGGGSFNPTSVSISSGTPTATFTYTPNATAGAKTLSFTNDGGLSNSANITYTASAAAAATYTVTGYVTNSTVNKVKDGPIDLATASNYTYNYSPAGKGLAPDKVFNNGNGYLYFRKNGAAVTGRVVSGWTTSPDQPLPSDILHFSTTPPSPNQNANTGSSKNGLVTAGNNGTNITDQGNLWVAAGFSGKMYHHVCEVDPAAPANAPVILGWACTNPTGLSFTNA